MVSGAPAPAPEKCSTGDSLIHWICCVDEVGICGAIIDEGEVDEEANCVVCIDLDAAGAPCTSLDCPMRG